MKHTNKNEFDEIIVEYLKSDDYDYDQNTLSATTLMQPPRMYALKKQNFERLEVDVEDLIASRYGTAIHDSVEKVNLTGCKQEERLKKAVKNRIITGKYDILREIGPKKWELIDVKSTSVWTIIYKSRDEDHKTQLSIYRWLAIQNGYDVAQTGKIWFFFTDWSAAKAKEDPEYPQTRTLMKDVELWGEDETLKYISERMLLLDKAVNMEQNDMPKCTDKELWSSEESWAIMKKDAKRALKVHKTAEEAQTHIRTLEGPYEIKNRPGKVARCRYCSARKFCNQYQDLIEAGRSENYEQ